jgi:hypothetical protein
MKTSELTGHALDWAVAKCEGYRLDLVPEGSYAPSTDWSQGGPIIEREKITLRIWDDEDYVHAYIDTGKDWYEGDTPLIAAMRCYVASKLGDEVEIPTELTQGETT